MKRIIADAKMPEEAKGVLSGFGQTVWFETRDIVYPAISGHPDIFMTQVNEKLIVAPNIPRKYIEFLKNHNISYTPGNKPVGKKYPETAYYNAMSDSSLILHNEQISDEVVMKYSEHLQKIHVKQGYCRCNCISLDGKGYVCSDRGIESVLRAAGKTVFYVGPEKIKLEDFLHGFFGGACGIIDNTVVICGSLTTFCEGEKLREFIENKGFEILELYNGPLTDVGGILFL